MNERTTIWRTTSSTATAGKTLDMGIVSQHIICISVFAYHILSLYLICSQKHALFRTHAPWFLFISRDLISIVPPSNCPWNTRPPNLATVACHEQQAPKPRVASLKLSWVLNVWCWWKRTYSPPMFAAMHDPLVTENPVAHGQAGLHSIVMTSLFEGGTLSPSKQSRQANCCYY